MRDIGRRVDEALRHAEERLEEAGQKINRSLGKGGRLDQESQRIISYLNDEVVPAVRSRSSQALRRAARKLSQFADHLEEDRRR